LTDLRKITEIVANICHILTLKCTKIYFGWGYFPDPSGELGLQCSPGPLGSSWDKGNILLRKKEDARRKRGGEGREGSERKGEGREREEKGVEETPCVYLNFPRNSLNSALLTRAHGERRPPRSAKVNSVEQSRSA